MSLLDSIQSLLKDPPPEFAFEISVSGIAMSRTRGPAILQHASLAGACLRLLRIKENIVDVYAFTAAIRKLIPAAADAVRRR